MSYTINSLIEQLEHMRKSYSGDTPVYILEDLDNTSPTAIDEVIWTIIDANGNDYGFDPWSQEPNAVVISA